MGSREKFLGACIAGMLIGGLLGLFFFGIYLYVNSASTSVVDVRGFYTIPKGWYLSSVDSGWVCHVVGVLNGSVKPEKTFNSFSKYSFIHRGNKTIVCDAMIGRYTKNGVEYYTDGGTMTGVFYSDHAVITVAKEFPWGQFTQGMIATVFCELLFITALFIVHGVNEERMEGEGRG